jgi:hypothetical protein
MTHFYPSQPHWRRWMLLIFLVGLLIEVALAVRSGIAGDQTHLLALGLRFADGGALEPWTKIMQGAGNNGALMQILIGVPLAIVEDHRSPLVVIVLFHVAAYFLIASVVRPALGERAALVYLFLLWLSPWRLYHSSFLWEPNYLLLPAALHLVACWRSRSTASFGSSMLLAASAVLAMQIHNSFLILALMTVVLVVRRSIRVHWGGLITGGVIVGLPLVLTVRALIDGALPSAGELQGFVGKGFVTVVPMLKGVLYWVRLGSLDVGVPLSQTVFIEEGIGRHGVMTVVAYALWVIGIVTIGFSLVASRWYLLPLWRRWRARRSSAPESESFEPEREDGWKWMRVYAVAALVALVVSAGLSPITLQGWMVVIALHAAVIPVACWIDERVPAVRRRGVIIGIAVAQLALALVICAGNRIFHSRPIDAEHMRRYPQLERLDDHRSR